MTRIVASDRLDLGAFVRRGDHLLWGQACAEPTTLVEHLIAQRAEIGPVNIFLGSAFSTTLRPEHRDYFKMRGIGGLGSNRRLTKAGVLQIVPCHVGQVANYIDQGFVGCDVLLLQLSPPGSDGRHSFGVASDYIAAAVARARVILAEINDRVPYTFGGAGIATDELDALIHTSRPLIEVPRASIGPTERAIAAHTARYIGDGTTLQIGIGTIPDAILQLISDRRDLGIHSGMLGDGVADLIEGGVVTNARKPIDRGASITGLLIGTHRVFDFANRNPRVQMRSSAYTHGETVLASIPNLITINSALEVDLGGQVNAEQTGEDYVGGIGGQADYVRAGHRSAGGRSIIVLPATAKNGATSRICSNLSGPVTSMRGDVDVVVTEFGAADLKGATIAERAQRLIQIAHPNFREALARAATQIARRGY